MAIFLSKRELAETEPAEMVAFRSPVPTRIVSNGEFNPLPQTADQRKVEARLRDLADQNGGKLGLDRRQFLRVHRSIIVNVDEVKELQSCGGGEYMVIMRNGKELPFGRTHREQLEGFLLGKAAAAAAR